MDHKEPYRATKLWNEVIIAFQHGMPLRKHRRKIYTYHDCFMASDAVTWIHCYLLNNPNFGQDVSRQQAINLLGKFLKCRVIENITSKSKKCEFSDNSHLYRFTPVTPQQFITLPLRLVQSPCFSRNKINCDKKESLKSVNMKKSNVPEFQKENIPECIFVEKKMSLTELGSIWKTATLTRLQNQLPDIDVKNLLDEKSLSGHVIKHNVCRISKTGVVSLIDKTDDIPHWVISAMKCLANWPNASGSGSCLPNYPGFEKDVFKVVRDFFINPQVPLLPTYLSTAMLTIFCHLLQDQLNCIDDYKSSFRKELNSFNSKHSPVLSAIVKTSTPLSDNDKERLLEKNISLTENSDGKLLLDDPEVMWDYPSRVFFETDFATSDPVTKMVPSQSSLHADYEYLCGSIESVSTISICSMNHKTNTLGSNQVLPSTSLKNWNSDSCLHEEMKDQAVSQTLQLCHNTSVNHYSRQCHSMYDCLPNSLSVEKLNDSVCSSKTLTEEEGKTSLCNSGDTQNVSVSSNEKLHSDISCNKSSPLSHCSQVSDGCKMRNSLKHFEGMDFPSELKSSFQLILLFMHPPNRRQLHLLFRVINKILKNNKFILDVKMPMRDYLLETFLPAIVQSDVNQNIVYGIVSFLLDNCESLFQPPPNLEGDVEELCRSRAGKIVYSVDDACSLTYCELVSKQQYEEQKVSVSTKALKSLLQNIIVDEKLSEKQRRKRIKQFKETHPDVYHEMFPGKHEQLVKSKSAFLNRFASLRM